MPLIHDGSQFWSALDQPDAPSLDRYFASAAPAGSLTTAADAALRSWPDVLASAADDSAYPSHAVQRLLDIAENAPATQPPRRCIFVSHRQTDSGQAVDLANAILAHRPNGSQPFDVWLDVWNPNLNLLQANPGLKPGVLTALIIEMGLINSIAAIALMTPRSFGSRWIPYEFGRVKKGGPFAQEASACLRDLHPRPSLDYMDLAPQIDYVRGQYHGLHDWLNRL